MIVARSDGFAENVRHMRDEVLLRERWSSWLMLVGFVRRRWAVTVWCAVEAR